MARTMIWGLVTISADDISSLSLPHFNLVMSHLKRSKVCKDHFMIILERKWVRRSSVIGFRAQEVPLQHFLRVAYPFACDDEEVDRPRVLGGLVEGSMCKRRAYARSSSCRVGLSASYLGVRFYKEIWPWNKICEIEHFPRCP